MKWVTAIGLIFQFLAFWFAAPELLGEATLKRLEKGIQKFATLAPLLITLVVILGYGISFIGLAIHNYFVMKETGEAIISPTKFFVIFGVFTTIYMVIMINYKRFRRLMEYKIAIPLTHRIVNNREARKTALLIGAILFTCGFLLQLLAVLIG